MTAARSLRAFVGAFTAIKASRVRSWFHQQYRTGNAVGKVADGSLELYQYATVAHFL